MNYVWFGIAGILGGVLGGMGMGGGTVLIPLLGIFYNVSQHTAQAVNLISFVPMAVGALIVHLKNKMIEFTVQLDTTDLGELNTVYAIAVTARGDHLLEINNPVKTTSILLVNKES